MSENQDDPGKPEVPPPSLHKEPSTPPPPSLSKGPAEPPPPSALSGAAGPPPPNPPASPPPPPAPVSGASPIKVKVRPDGGDGEDDGEGAVGPLVTLSTRVGAAMIDLAIAMGLYIAVVKVMPDLLGSLAWPVAAAYIVLRDGLPFLGGQSVGKTAMKIRAVTRDGKSLSGNWQPAVVRNVVLLIPLFPIVELIVLITREDKSDQGVRLGDEWAKTRVVPVARNKDREEQEEEEEEEEDKHEAS